MEDMGGGTAHMEEIGVGGEGGIRITCILEETIISVPQVATVLEEGEEAHR